MKGEKNANTAMTSSANKLALIMVCLFALLVIAVFAFFSPFTYGFGLTEDQFEMRNWFSFGKLEVVR